MSPDECPALQVLRGCMGHDLDGNPIYPKHQPYRGHCGNCGVVLTEPNERTAR